MPDDDDLTTDVWYHGTHTGALPDILVHGLRPVPLRPLIDRIETAYGLPTESVWNHDWFAFSRERDTDPYVYLSSDRSDAEFYATTGPETLQDALLTVYRLLNEPEDGDRDYRKRGKAWAVDQTPRFIGSPVVLRVNLPVVNGGHHHREMWVPAERISVA